MTTDLLFAALTMSTLVALALVGAWTATRTTTTPEADDRPGGWRALLRDRVVVHTIDGQSVRGLVAQDLEDAVVLEPADWIHDRGATPVGRVTVAHSRVSWIQLLGPLDEPAVDEGALRKDPA